jgi:PAS domain S-box-containing protein
VPTQTSRLATPMRKTILVNFHCHSIFSDGEQTPEALAANLAGSGVRYAALTDHDSIEGLPRFQEAIKKRGATCLPGVELTTQFNGREAHLLGYGFDPEYPDLAATLLSLRQVRDLEVHSIAGSLRKIGSNRPVDSDNVQAISAAPAGRLEIEAAIALLHRAGGRAFWAHPLMYESDPERLDGCVAELKSKGLDGLEAIYDPFSEKERADLSLLAKKHALLICAGTDFHAGNGNGQGGRSYGIEMLREDWIKFRGAVFSSPTFSADTRAAKIAVPNVHASRQNPKGTPHHFRRRSYVLRIFLPTLIAIGLFLAAIWGIILPSFEQTLLERKRDLIRELTNSAWSILASYERDEQSGLLTLEQAQALAITRIEALRYGPQGKDYFWIQDMQPRMIMHPYRSDLNGQELQSFTDARGVPIFAEFAELVRQKGEGYIDYVWQWNDDPQRLEPKQSFVKGFEPWGWVIGTGIYIDDVKNEIARIEQNLTNTSLIISGAVVLLLLFVLQQSLRIERERQEVLDTLHESTERYHTLIEATTEGTLLIVEERCRYANPTFLNMTGYTPRQLDFLELSDLLPHQEDNQAIWERFERMTSEKPVDGETLEGILKHADGRFVECILTLNSIVFAEQRGFILLARDVAHQSTYLNEEAISHAAQAAPLGIFRARAARRAVLLEMNSAARTLVAHIGSPQPALADLFSDPAEFDAFFQTLQSNGEVNNHILHLETSDATAHFLSLSARLVRDERKHTAYIDGILEDVTTVRKQDIGREALIEKLQASLLFLHEPIAKLGRDVVVCDMNTNIEQLSRLMTARNVTAALISSENSAVIGIVTDHDLRARVLAENIPASTPVHTIMSAPLIKISEHALIYEALMHMEEKNVRHLAVEDRDGQIVSVIDNKSLIQFQRYGPIVLAREISRIATPEEVARCSERTPPLVKALMGSSARPRHVTNMLASICDAITERLVQLAIAELGPPPAAFAFIAMGSQGRQEQTLLTDQDNGIIFAPTAEAAPNRVNDYFLRLGTRVCDGLNRAGYSFCRGQVMASNPRWCRSLPDWISGFNEWILKSEPQEIIDLSIFFDFRTVYGDADLTHELRRAIHAALVDQAPFFHHFAENALLFKPPFRLLGNIYLSGGTTEHAGEINLKDAMMPMVSFARLYALQHQINQTHTLERIEALTERNVILPSSRDEITTAYDFLMQLRLQNQLAAIQVGQSPQNIIHPGKLGYIQQELLKQAFAQIAAVQKKVSYDFLGGI